MGRWARGGRPAQVASCGSALASAAGFFPSLGLRAPQAHCSSGQQRPEAADAPSTAKEQAPGPPGCPWVRLPGGPAPQGARPRARGPAGPACFEMRWRAGWGRSMRPSGPGGSCVPGTRARFPSPRLKSPLRWQVLPAGAGGDDRCPRPSLAVTQLPASRKECSCGEGSRGKHTCALRQYNGEQ